MIIPIPTLVYVSKSWMLTESHMQEMEIMSLRTVKVCTRRGHIRFELQQDKLKEHSRRRAEYDRNGPRLPYQD